MTDHPAASPAQTLRELQELLRTVAALQPVQRPWPVAYTACRAALLAGPLRTRLPGFIVQCGSIDRFRDFISLYHPRAESRLAFIDSAFRACWGELHAEPGPRAAAPAPRPTA